MPAAFPLQAQYIKSVKKARKVAANAAEDSGVPTVHVGEESSGDEASEKPRKKKVVKTKGVKANAKSKKSEETSWNYNSIRTDFIKTVRKDKGLDFQAAKALWDSSQEKKGLLGALTVPELKRRRFVEKDCQENPWA